MSDTYKKEITYSEYIQLEGLMAIASNAYGKVKEAELAMKEILNYESPYDNYCGPLSDITFEDNPNVKKCLKNMEITILKNGRTSKSKD